MPDQGQKGRAPHRSAVPKLAIATLGAFAAYAGGREVRIGNRKSRALVAYLALSEAGEQTRERLVGILWSETEEAKARASLRQALYEIREALSAAGFDGLKSDKLSVTLDRSAISVDLVDVLDQARDGQAHALLLERQRLLDTLLEEFETIDPAFRVWLLAKRQSFHDRIVRQLETALRNPSTKQGGQRELALALINLDPTHEEAARTLIRAHVAEGDIGAALRVYKALWDLLEEEYDVEPSKETQELIAAVRMGQPTGPPSVVAPIEPVPKPKTGAGAPLTLLPAAPEGPKRPDRWGAKLVVSIAAFEATVAPAQQQYLVQGFRRELMACLVRFREWSVRDAGHLVAAPAAPLASATDEYVIEASALPAGQALRLLLTLKHAPTGLLLWSERLQLTVADWFEAQQNLVRRLATALNVHVSAERLAAVAPKPDADLRVYDLWLRGQALILSFDPRDWHRASDLFRQAIQESAQFAPAYSSLAQLQNTIHFVHPGIFRESRRTEEAVTFGREATRLDPVDSRSHLALGWALAMAAHHDQAAIHHTLAQELNDNDPWTLTSAGLGHAFGGDPDHARQLVQLAAEHMPSPGPIHWRYRAIIEHMSRNHAGCVEAAEQAASSVPNELGWKVSALSHLGDERRAHAELERFFTMVSQRWCGTPAPTRREMTRWFLHLFPIKRQEDWEHLRDGLARAGAPVDGITLDATSVGPTAVC